MKAFFKSLAVGLALCLTASVATGQEVHRIQLKPGHVLQYRVQQTSRVTDGLNDQKTEMVSKVQQVKHWKVLEVGPDGTATIELSLARMAMEQQLPTGETWKYDSAKPNEGSPQLRDQLTPFIGRPLATIRVDNIGRVVEVKSVFQGSPSRYDSELPFMIVLPGVSLQAGQSWVRDYRIALDPPIGTGEKYAAQQQYQVVETAGGKARIRFTTTIKDLPPNPSDQLPLMQFQPQGEVAFDMKRGLVTSARFTSGGTVKEHHGEGSWYEYRSDYQEQLVLSP